VLAAGVRNLLDRAGIVNGESPSQGFDHGTFVPMSLMFPQADVPVVLLSLKAGYNPAEHIRAGQALQPLRDEGVLIIGSGLTYHNMQGFRQPGAMQVSRTFEQYLADAVTGSPQQRLQKLAEWQQAPAARQAHPREDHLMPLLVAAGAAGDDEGRVLVTDEVMNVSMTSYRFG